LAAGNVSSKMDLLRAKYGQYRKSIVIVCLRGASIVLNFITLFFFGHVLKNEQFALFLVVSNIATIVISQDFGISSAGRLQLVRLIVAKDERGQQAVISTLLLGTLVFVTSLFLVLVVVHPAVTSVGLPQSARWLVYSVVGFSLFAVVGSVTAHAWFARERAEAASAFDVGRLVVQLALGAAAFAVGASPDTMILCFFLPHILYTLLITAAFWRNMRWSPSLIVQPLRQFRAARALFWRTWLYGLPLWIFQLSQLALNSLDVTLTGALLGLADAGTVALLLRLNNLLLAFLTSAMMPYLGTYGIKFHERDFAAIRRSIKEISAILVGLAAAYCVVLQFFGRQFVLLWTAKDISNHWLFLLGGIYLLVQALGVVYSTALTGIGTVKRILVPVSIVVFVKVAAAFFLARFYFISGLLCACIGSYVLYLGVMMSQMRRLLSPSSGSSVEVERTSRA
jgi:O-antigen/teichoic acid export membrane protein